MSIERIPAVRALPSRDGLSRHEALRRHLRDLRETERRTLLLAHDLSILATLLSLSLALTGRPQWPVALTWLAVTVTGLYATEQYALRPHHDRALTLSILTGFLASLAVAACFPPLGPTAIALVVALGAIGLLLPAGRRLLENALTHPVSRQRVLLFGTPLEASEAYQELQRHPLSGKHPIGLVMTRGYLPQPFPLLVLGQQDQLPHAAERWNADMVVAGLEALQTPSWGRRLPPALGTTDLPTLCARLSGRVPVRRVDARWFVEHFRWRRGWLYKGLARTRDVVVAGTALISLAPLMMAIALALACERSGSALLVHPHLGRHGRVFPLHAFRTLGPNRRVTRVGHLLRATRLNKLPHLWSVLWGEMSLIGPTPHPVEMAAELAGYMPHYQRRHLVKPGLLGWAQVRDPFGPAVRDLEQVLGYDLFYVYQRSHRLDAVILLRSAWVPLARAAAPFSR